MTVLTVFEVRVENAQKTDRTFESAVIFFGVLYDAVACYKLSDKNRAKLSNMLIMLE